LAVAAERFWRDAHERAGAGLRRSGASLKNLLKSTRSSFALEFAMTAPVFFALLLMVFEVSYDEFLQEVLDDALQTAARDIQVGATQNTATPSAFMSGYFCPTATHGLLNCNSLYLRIEQMNFTTGTCQNLDYYDAVAGGGPVVGGVLGLGDFWSTGGQGSGSVNNLSPCSSTTSTYPGYCNPGSSEMVLLTAVYTAPSFLGGLLSPVKYNGSYVRPIYATAALTTEPFVTVANRPSPC
jgi:hypothetical protein